MNIQTIGLIAIAVLFVIAIVLLILLSALRLRSRKLKNKYGPEYDYTLEKTGDRQSAEADLKEREKRVQNLSIRPLNEDEKERYQREWIEIQASFIDDPKQATDRANREITEVMIARGFPVADFEQRTADLSVMYPDLIPGYREANSIIIRSREDGVTTEELRQAIVRFHSVFNQLIEYVHQQDKTMEVSS